MIIKLITRTRIQTKEGKKGRLRKREEVVEVEGERERIERREEEGALTLGGECSCGLEAVSDIRWPQTRSWEEHNTTHGDGTRPRPRLGEDKLAQEITC